MLPTLSIFLVVGALVTVIMASMGKCPVWVPVLLVVVFAALQVMPR